MALKPRWTFPLNFRAEDKLTLDAATEIARRHGSDLTSVIRLALEEYVQRNKAGLVNETKIDEFIREPRLQRLCLPILEFCDLKNCELGVMRKYFT